jgi:hypothetical protein
MVLRAGDPASRGKETPGRMNLCLSSQFLFSFGNILFGK